MKKITLSLSCLALFSAVTLGIASIDTAYANSGAITESTVLMPQATKAKPKIAAKTNAKANETFEKGQKLIAASDCGTCHKIDKKLIGPAYIDVAKKYPSKKENFDYLAHKIIKGGKGVWGQIPMAPHPGISEADAKEMAKYILSLNK
ncbi:hypothetical protein TH63_09045 [Rufibacter radiotolerans]|uniref:Cytochrome c domain-containing protein n=1 Tax=Rufibacter radiotolerans TaxID=1379910 RepID=A0A0H4W5R7_9BACT|nr:c-type cytochrome [Rufibacter radiotolerans]AKQ45761.1 hypothetical protein TH63_09045 [Rufibacter radiotolerans]